MSIFEAPFQIGSSYTFADGVYAVKGRMVLRSKDPEDGLYYPWEEYLAISPKGEQVWITYEHYEKTYAINEEIDITRQPDISALIAGTKVSLDTEDGVIEVSISETNIGEVTVVEGENPWNVNVGDKIPYMDGIGSGANYGLEVYGGMVELYEMVLLPTKDIELAATKTHGKTVKLPSSKKKSKNIVSAVTAVVFMGLFGLGSAIGGLDEGTSRRDCQASDINQAQPLEWSSSSQQQAEIDSGSACRDSTTGRYYRNRSFVGGSTSSGK